STASGPFPAAGSLPRPSSPPPPALNLPAGALRIDTPSGGVKFSDAGAGPVFASIDTNKSMSIDPKMLKSALAKFSKAEKNLATLHAVGAVLATANEPRIFFARLMDHIFDVVSADRGAIFIREKDHFLPQVTRTAEGKTEEIAVSQTILRRAVHDGVSLLTSDAAADERFKAGASIIMQQIRSAICVPIRGRSEVFGAIYVDSKIARGAFTDDDLELLTTIAVQAGIALENSRLSQEAARAERMAAIGLVVSGLAHDIKNYMMALKGGDFILDAIIKGIPSPEAQQSWATLKATHKSISDLVMDMLSYSKARDPEWANMDINGSVAEAMQVCRERAQLKGIELTQEMDYAIGPFYYDPKNISRCIMNILGNAIDATPEGGGRSIALRTRVEAEPGPDGTAVVEVADQGTGIPPEARDKVFDLMYSTKGSKGTGLGLALTRKIVEEHGGTVTFETEMGKGTTFIVRLPRRRKRPAPGQR
ncbi:MAG: GAF domain-containing sensor histidine kinase, partial [Planctomycetaceae bacterium]|nr:GAF domain-containing sensor histidine kinase [Planctomycetaceae bacterium]